MLTGARTTDKHEGAQCMPDHPISHGLGFPHGGLIEHPDGTVEYRQTGKILPAFRVRVRDVTGFSVRKVTRDDKKRLKATSMQQVLTVQGSGTTLAEVAINHGTAQKIEDFFRAHRDFGIDTQSSAPAEHQSPQAVAPTSVADELMKLAQLRDAGVITPDEFAAQKSKLLG
ncbi:SHOCT domain-containing protein [Nocardia uniformis]|uniref:SHOCT domain-containing protein n=1 Tax=Nocardia uniformis TaxID=53432 RepID=A0A849CAK7_9NOCA|nr:SHOCT domain-containing protein [Nocardia uniformis]NNH72977.1 SHOCT domain-containing protein [Nocardia uniformis]